MGVAGYTWKMKIIGLWGRKRKTEKEGEEKNCRRKIFGKGTYLEKEHIWRRKIFGEGELMMTSTTDRPTTDRANINQSASGNYMMTEGRGLQNTFKANVCLSPMPSCFSNGAFFVSKSLM